MYRYHHEASICVHEKRNMGKCPLGPLWVMIIQLQRFTIQHNIQNNIYIVPSLRSIVGCDKS